MKTERILSHQEAQSLIQRAADGSLNAAEQELLVLHLDACADCRRTVERLAKLEGDLRSLLQRRYPQTHISEIELEAVLKRIHTPWRNPLKRTLTISLRVLGYSALAILVALVLNWSIRTVLPEEGRMGQESTETVFAGLTETPTPNEVPMEDTGTPAPPLPTETPTPRPTPQPGSIGLLPGVTFNFNEALPEGPGEVPLYQQSIPEEVTVASALAAAQQLGVIGSVYTTPSEMFGQTLLHVSDGTNDILFLHFASQYIWNRDVTLVNAGYGEMPPFEQMVAAAEAFLQPLGLLDRPYRAEPAMSEPGVVRFIPLLDDRPLQSGIGDNRGATVWVNVTLNPDLSVAQVGVSQRPIEEMGSYPILSAEQAWQRFSETNAPQRSRWAVLAAPQPNTYRSWQRTYPVNQRVDLYNYPQMLQPAEAGGKPLVLFGSFGQLAEGSQPLNPPNAWDMLHVWGKFIPQDEGNPRLLVEGWEVSNRQEENMDGKIERQGDQAFLVATDRRLLLPDLPADVRDGAEVNATGVVIAGNPLLLEWRFIQSGGLPSYYGASTSCWGGGGGGSNEENANIGDGALNFPILSTQPEQPTPSPQSFLQVGERLDGVSGQLTVLIARYPDGREVTEISLNLEVSDSYPNGGYLKLEGNLEDIEKLHNLPVRVWGAVSRLDGSAATPVLSVERYEAMYPGLTITEFDGTQEIKTVDGKEVVLLHANGQTYLLRSSLLFSGGATIVGHPGDLVEVEGYVLPEQTYGGYPLLAELSAGMPPDYVVTSSEPGVYDNFDTSSPAITGSVTITSVELVYDTIQLTSCSAAQASPELQMQLVIQPIWVFKGVFEDGRTIELQMDALPEEYFTQ